MFAVSSSVAIFSDDPLIDCEKNVLLIANRSHTRYEPVSDDGVIRT